MQHYLRVQENLRARPKRWLITGVAGFVGSNLLETLLNLDQEVIGIDNLAVGSSKALLDIKASVSATRWSRFTFSKADITSFAECKVAFQQLDNIDYVLHHAGLNSQSADISEVNRVNVCGFLNVLEAAQESQVQRFVYASSSPASQLTHPSSPNTYLNELHATTCYRNNNSNKPNNSARTEMTTVALRYQNVFGKGQANHSSNPAIVPYWIEELLAGEQCTLYGSKDSRKDFVHIDDVVQANILAAIASDAAANQCYDITSGYYLSLEELFNHICKAFDTYYPELTVNSEAYTLPSYLQQKQDTQIDIYKAMEYLKFQPRNSLADDVAATISWYHRAYMQEILTHA